jgi:formate-dependent nitrite reductase membrane component NrfD
MSKISEQRLEEIKQLASEGKLANHPTAGITAHPQIQGRDPYYGLPALKPPVWTWEVPLYFFIGGISGVSACIAFAAQIFSADPALIRLLVWMGFVGALVCPVLLIADLGRPARFLNMLRVFKWRSAMSMGAWILVAFSGAIATSLAGVELPRWGFDGAFVTALRWLGGIGSTVTGLLLASYTAVLIGATAIPVWFKNRVVLPVHFLCSGLGSAAGICELAGFLIPDTHLLGFFAAGVETLLEAWFLLRRTKVNEPMHHGGLGAAFLISGALEGPASLLLRIFLGTTPAGRWAAALSFLTGALISRFCWIRAGKVSALDSRGQFEMQRRGEAVP